MKIRIGRILITAICVEFLAIALLVLIVAVFGPRDAGAAQIFAERIGTWFGPLAGFILCIVGGWFVAKRLSTDHVVNGLVLGIAVAAIDVILLVAGGSPFHFVFVVSNVGRIIAGAIGGWIASKRSIVSDT